MICPDHTASKKLQACVLNTLLGDLSVSSLTPRRSRHLPSFLDYETCAFSEPSHPAILAQLPGQAHVLPPNLMCIAGLGAALSHGNLHLHPPPYISARRMKMPRMTLSGPKVPNRKQCPCHLGHFQIILCHYHGNWKASICQAPFTLEGLAQCPTLS